MLYIYIYIYNCILCIILILQAQVSFDFCDKPKYLHTNIGPSELVGVCSNLTDVIVRFCLEYVALL